MVFPANNLPSTAQPWTREVQKRVENIEATAVTNEVNNVARDAQLSNSVKRINTIVTSVFSAGTTEINGYNIKAGTIDADAINVGTLTGFTIQTGSTGSRVVMDSAGIRAYNSSNVAVLNFTTSNGLLSLSGFLEDGEAANDINNGSTTISGTKITTGTLSADKIYAGTISASSINLTSSSYQLTVGNSSQFAYLNVLPGSSNGVTINSIGFQSTSTAGWNTNMYPYLNNSVYCGLQAFAWAGIRSVTAVVVTSDERTKNSITESDLGLNFIDSLRPVSYKYNVGKNEIVRDEDGEITGSVEKPGNRVHYGLIAQEVKQTLDELGVEDFGGWVLDDIEDPDSTQALRYEEFISPLIKAVQELSAKVKQLENKQKRRIMTDKPEIDIQEVLVYFRQLVGAQAQEIALLKATIVAMENKDKVEQFYGKYF